MRRREAGQVVFESALTLTAFLLVVFGMLDLGRAYWNWQSLGTVAREGGRWAIVHGSDAGLTATQTGSQAQTHMQTAFAAALPAGTTMAVDWPDGSNAPGQRVRVTLTSQFQPITPFLGLANMTLRGVSEMEIQR